MTNVPTRTKLRRGLISAVRMPASGGVTNKELDLLLNGESPNASSDGSPTRSPDDFSKKIVREYMSKAEIRRSGRLTLSKEVRKNPS